MPKLTKEQIEKMKKEKKLSLDFKEISSKGLEILLKDVTKQVVINNLSQSDFSIDMKFKIEDSGVLEKLFKNMVKIPYMQIVESDLEENVFPENKNVDFHYPENIVKAFYTLFNTFKDNTLSFKITSYADLTISGCCEVDLSIFYFGEKQLKSIDISNCGHVSRLCFSTYNRIRENALSELIRLKERCGLLILEGAKLYEEHLNLLHCLNFSITDDKPLLIYRDPQGASLCALDESPLLPIFKIFSQNETLRNYKIKDDLSSSKTIKIDEEGNCYPSSNKETPETQPTSGEEKVNMMIKEKYIPNFFSKIYQGLKKQNNNGKGTLKVVRENKNGKKDYAFFPFGFVDEKNKRIVELTIVPKNNYSCINNVYLFNNMNNLESKLPKKDITIKFK